MTVVCCETVSVVSCYTLHYIDTGGRNAGSIFWLVYGMRAVVHQLAKNKDTTVLMLVCGKCLIHPLFVLYLFCSTPATVVHIVNSQ